MAEQDNDVDLIPFEGTHEDPQGEEVDVPYIGTTNFFSELQLDRVEGRQGKHNPLETLDYHVPLNMRGPYKLTRFPGKYGEREGPAGYAMCCGKVKTSNGGKREVGSMCRAKAINRSGYCSRHGGALNPLDRKRIDWDQAPRHIRFKYGKLSVDDLDDEELARGQIRKPNGEFTDNKFVSSEIHNKMIAKLFDRSDQMLRENLLLAVETFAEIASGTAYEPADRLKAAEFIFTRLRGKVPQEIKLGVDKPFEKVLDAVLTGGPRDERRRTRVDGVHDDSDDYLDAEVVDPPEIQEGYDEEGPGSGADADGSGNDHYPSPDIDPGFIRRELEEIQEEPVEEDEGDGGDDLGGEEEDTNRVIDDYLPKPVTSTGPVGKPTTAKPYGGYEAQQYEKRENLAEKEAEARRRKVFRKRTKSPEEIAEERKAHQEEMRRQIAKRKSSIKKGFANLPEGVKADTEEDEEGNTTFRFKGTDHEKGMEA